MVREGDSCASPPQTITSYACTECGGAGVGIQGLIAGGVNAPGGEHALRVRMMLTEGICYAIPGNAG